MDAKTHLVTTADFRELTSWGTAVDEGSQRYSITIPHIVNDKKIRTGERVVLKWYKESEKEKPKVQKKHTAFDNIAVKAAKKQKKS